MIAEANDIDVMPIFAISEADIVDAINYADMGDSSLLEAYDNMIAQCLEEDVDLCMISLDEADAAAADPGMCDKIKGCGQRAYQSVKNAGSYTYNLAKNNPKSAIALGATGLAAGAYAGKKMYDKRKAKKAAAAAAAAEQERLANRSRFEVARDTAKAKIAQMRNK